MNLNIIKTEILEDKMKRIIVKIPLNELIYFGYFIEAFEGWCNYTTVNKHEQLVQIDISPDFIEETEELITFLKHWKI
jgi:hypothetical protein